MRGDKKVKSKKFRISRKSSDIYYPIGSRLATLEDLNKKEPVPAEINTRVQVPISRNKPRLKFLILGISILAGIGVWYAFHKEESGDGGFQISYYATYSQAISRGAVQGGWIPRYIPNEAYAIHEMHDVKTNSGWISFKFPPSARNRMMERYTPIAEHRLKGMNIGGTKAPWWPADLNGPVSAGIMKNYSIYMTGRSSYKEYLEEYMAVDWEKAEAFIWR